MAAAPTMDAAVYRWLFEHAPVHGIALLDGTGCVLDVNTAGARLTGPAAVAGARGLLDALGFPGGAAPALARARTGRPVVRRAWVQGADGRRRWCESTLSAMPDGDGNVMAYAVIIADVTEARRRELAHPETERCFATALERAPVFVFQQDLELRYAWVPSPIPALGVADPGMALGRTDAELLPAAAAGELEARKRAVLDSGQGLRAEVELGPDAGGFVLDLTLEPVRDAAGEIQGLTCAAIDVTERRRAEDDLRRSRRLLGEAEHLARMGSWEWDIARDEIQWSDGLYAIYGLTPETFDARYAAREQRVHPDDRERVDAAVRGALETCGEIDIDYRIVRPDGRVRLLHGRAEVIVGDDGRPVRMAGTAQDVTELRAAQEALERTAAEIGRRAADLHRAERHPAGGEPGVSGLLSDRQVEILALIADGLNNAEIAGRLFLSEATVKWHVRQILQKLRVANRTEAVALYARTQRGGG